MRLHSVTAISVTAAASLATASLLGYAALNSSPATPRITEPATDGRVVSPADVHMETAPFSDPDPGDTHRCTDWEIWTIAPVERVWVTSCIGGLEKLHTHLGDGRFENSFAGRFDLEPERDYRLRARHRDGSGDPATEWSAWAERYFRTEPSAIGTAVPWTFRQPGYRVDVVAGGFQLPVNIAFVPNPGASPSSPLFYVSELYGTIKVVTRDFTVRDYATGLLNFNPTGNFPGSGEQGLTGIVVDPATGHVYAGMLYDRGGVHYPKVVRFESADGGLTAARQTVLLDIPDPQGQSHQISNFSIGPDRKLYVHMGDGFNTPKAQDLRSFLGKILRLNLDGSPAVDNPFYNASDGIGAADYVYALGFRNPFGGAWRLSDGQLHEVENGPSVDRLALVVRGRNYMWDGTNESMEAFATYSWTPSTAPVNLAFIQAGTFNGSGFPPAKLGHAYMSESGPTWATGPQSQGKRITELVIDANGQLASAPMRLLEYTGQGKATVAALAAGPDGLYFSELYKDTDYTSAIDRGARIFRVRHVGGGDPTGVAVPGIIQAENFDEGGEGVAYHDSTTGNAGGAYRQTDVDLQATTDLGGGYNVGWIAAGEWLTYTVNVAQAGTYTLEARVASNGTGGAFHVEVNGTDITGPLMIPNTGGWQTWTTLKRTVALNAGPQSLRIVFDTNGPGGAVGNLNFLRLVGGAAVPGTIEAENFDEGGEGAAYHDSTTGNAGGAYRQTDVDLQATTDPGGGYNVGWMTAGEWLNYTVSVTSAGAYTLTARVAANGAGGTFHVEFGGVDKTGPLTIPNTGGWQAWRDVKATVTLDSGVQLMRFVADSNGPTGVFGNLNYLKLAAQTTAPSDIVLYASDLTLHGTWVRQSDSTAAAGQKALTPDAGWSTTSAPLASPTHSLEATFDAPAATPYTLWLRLRATGDTKYSESVWVQLSDARANGAAVYPIGSTSGLLVNLEPCFSCGVAGWGWQNRAYWLSQATTLTFATAGRHTLRIQVREDGAQLDQVVLSPSRYLNAPPGPVRNDSTIVPK